MFQHERVVSVRNFNSSYIMTNYLGCYKFEAVQCDSLQLYVSVQNLTHVSGQDVVFDRAVGSRCRL